MSLLRKRTYRLAQIQIVVLCATAFVLCAWTHSTSHPAWGFFDASMWTLSAIFFLAALRRRRQRQLLAVMRFGMGLVFAMWLRGRPPIS